MIRHVDELISAYIDDELTDSERKQVEDHIQSCSHCKVLLEDLSLIRTQLLSTYQTIQVSDQLEDLILQQVHDTPQVVESTTSQKRWNGMALAMVCVAFLFLISPFLYFSDVISTMLHIGVRLVSLVPVLIISLPALATGIVICALLLVILCVWSLRNLLGGRRIENKMA